MYKAQDFDIGDRASCPLCVVKFKLLNHFDEVWFGKDHGFWLNVEKSEV